MENDWLETSLGDVVELKRGYDLPNRDRRPGRVPIVSSSGVSGAHSEAKVSAPGVVTGRYGTIGQVFFIEDDFWPLNTTLYVRDFKGNDPKFISYFLTTIDYLAYSDKAAVPGVNRNHLHQARVRIPPVEKQRRIADILGTLDDKIELNRRMNETLEAMARRLFKSWFVDFDPVHAKAALRREHPKLSNAALSRRALPTMAPEIAELFPDSFEDSTLGPIPKGWHATQIADVSETNGWTLGKNDELAIIDYIEISQVMKGDVREIARYRRGEEPSRARRRLRHGDVVLSTVRPDRSAYFVAIDPSASLIASTGFAVFTSIHVPWSWTACALTLPEVFEYLGHHADGGAYPAVNPTLIGKIEYAIPGSAGVLNAFHSVVSEWHLLAAAHRRESERLSTIREKLLPRLLSGELSIINQEVA